MRIIAGEKKSRKLIAPDGLDTRPTGDKAREALFSILGSRVWDCSFLDLYAGSGAVALEALSRGAGEAVLCDKDRKAAKAILANITALDYAARARFLPMTDLTAVETLSREGKCFDIVFLDPPYAMDTAPICEKMRESGLIGSDTLLVIEHRHETPPALSEAFMLTDRRRYGIAGISFYKIVTDTNLEQTSEGE